MDERLAAVADLAGDGLVGESETIRRVAALVQRLLAIDITIVSEITADDRYLFRAIETAVELPIEEGAHIPYTWSLCSRIHAGEAGAATADTRENTGLSRNWARLKDGLGVDWDILAFMTTDVPLPDGGRFGTLCVHHTSTREWTTDERAVLVNAARLYARRHGELGQAVLVGD